MAKLLPGFENVLRASMLPRGEHGEADSPYKNLRTLTFSFVPGTLSRETLPLAFLYKFLDGC